MTKELRLHATVHMITASEEDEDEVECTAWFQGDEEKRYWPLKLWTPARMLQVRDELKITIEGVMET